MAVYVDGLMPSDSDMDVLAATIIGQTSNSSRMIYHSAIREDEGSGSFSLNIKANRFKRSSCQPRLALMQRARVRPGAPNLRLLITKPGDSSG